MFRKGRPNERYVRHEMTSSAGLSVVKSKRELIVEAANDVGVPKTTPELLSWIVRFFLRLWDEPALREWRANRKELLANWRGAGQPNITQTEQFQYDLYCKLERNVYSIRRSLDRLRKMGKI